MDNLIPAEKVAASSAAYSQYPPLIFSPNTSAPPCEQSTLVYTLSPDCNDLTWDEFSLIIRSLHSYRVYSIEESKTSGTISVTVGYFANTANSRKRLGNAGQFIGVSRLSSSVQLNELQTLQRLRAKFEFGGPVEEEEPLPPIKGKKPAKRPKYASNN